MPKCKLFIYAFKLIHDLSVKLGGKPMHVAQYAKKFKTLYKVLCDNVMNNAVNYAKRNGFNAIICGHTHYPQDKVVNGVRYINTGAWTELPVYCLMVNSFGIALKKIDNYLFPQLGVCKYGHPHVPLTLHRDL